MKNWVAGLANNTWMKKIIHRDDATGEEKQALLDEAKASPPMSRMYAFLHPPLMMTAHKQLKRYQGKTWVWPRLFWIVGVTAVVIPVTISNLEVLDSAATPGEAIPALVNLYIFPATIVLIAHFLTTVSMRMTETCVWCHVVQINSHGSIEATLSILAYRLPFIDPSRTEVSPWRKETGTYWKSTQMDLTLETERDISQLKFAHIYDETVCRVRPATAIPPSAKRYVAGRTHPYGDIAIKEKRGIDLGLGPQFRTVVITGIISVVCAIPGIILGIIYL